MRSCTAKTCVTLVIKIILFKPCKLGKLSDCGKILNLLWRCLQTTFKGFQFNAILDLCHFAKAWKHATAVLVSEKGQDRLFSKNCSPFTGVKHFYDSRINYI